MGTATIGTLSLCDGSERHTGAEADQLEVQLGCDRHRLPSVVLDESSGTLLAFAEGKVETMSAGAAALQGTYSRHGSSTHLPRAGIFVQLYSRNWLETCRQLAECVTSALRLRRGRWIKF